MAHLRGLFKLRIPIVCLFALCSLAAFGQAQVPPTTKPDPVALLNEVAQNYARAKTYHIEAVEEVLRINPQFYEWNESRLKAIQGTGNRFRFQIKTGMGSGSWLQISDGKMQWFYSENLGRYMELPASPDGPSEMVRVMGFGGEMDQAKSLTRTLEASASQHHSVIALPDETLSLNGQTYACYVVHDSRQAEFAPHKFPNNYERTFWIEKQNKVIRKVVGTSNAYSLGDDTFRHPVYSMVTTTTYPVVQLNVRDPDSEFLFQPPANTKKVATLDPPEYIPRSQPANLSTLLNQPAPPVDFIANSGQTISLASYRGKPVLLDFWATWCSPCMESMPKLVRLEQQLRGKGIALISIDEDTDPQTAEQYFARHQYQWTDFHDNNGAILKAFQGKVVPLLILIDSDGRVRSYENTWDGLALRSAIAKLGPQYATFAPK